LFEAVSTEIQRRLLLLASIGNQAIYKIDQEVGHATMARMLDLGEVPKLINHILDQLAP
jgi:hypothetical protein